MTNNGETEYCFWGKTPCRCGLYCQCFGDSLYLHLQDEVINQWPPADTYITGPNVCGNCSVAH